MGHVIQRFGFSIGRGWMILLLIAAGLVAASFWIGPLRPLPPEFELLAVAGDTATANVTVEGVRAPDNTLRFPLRVAMRNVGAAPGHPAGLSLSVPAHYRVSTNRGPLDGEVVAGVPLRRYQIPMLSVLLPPGTATHRIPALDTLWLEPDLPSYYCQLQGGVVPEFLPAPQYNGQLMSNVLIYYSFGAHESEERNTGVITVHVDSTVLRNDPAPMPPSFRTVFREPEAPTPELGELRKGGSRTAYCGDPERALELVTVQWLTPGGGRLYVVYSDDAPRKKLFDLNADDIIELETWDADGDGRFEARREARYRVPDFLVPRAGGGDSRLLPDTIAPDSAWLALFRDTRQGPLRFSPRVRAEVAAARAAFVRDSIALDSARLAAAAADSMRRAADALAPRVAASDTAVAPPDPAWLELYNDTAAGPFRFSRGVARDTATSDTTPPVQQRAAPRPRAPLGTPVPYPRPDTLRS